MPPAPQPISNACAIACADPALALEIPFVHTPRTQAGFPSPAADYVEDTLDLNRYLIDKPSATFCVRIQGDSMVDAGVFDGDIGIVDRSKPGRLGEIVVAAYEGDLVVKRFGHVDKRLALLSENAEKNYAPPVPGPMPRCHDLGLPDRDCPEIRKAADIACPRGGTGWSTSTTSMSAASECSTRSSKAVL